MTLGRETGFPLVSGGDRHGREPNGIVNLSRGTSIVEFIREVRYSRFSHIVFMPQYHEPLKLRILQTMVDIMRDYPENPHGRNSWMQRVFYRDPNGDSPVPLSALWNNGAPKIVNHFVSAMRILRLRSVQSILRFALDDRAKVWEVPPFPPFELDREAAV
jgi:hypothetical protein